jgi:hypothetical protein
MTRSDYENVEQLSVPHTFFLLFDHVVQFTEFVRSARRRAIFVATNSIILCGDTKQSWIDSQAKVKSRSISRS